MDLDLEFVNWVCGIYDFSKRKKREFCIINRKAVHNGALELVTTSNPKKMKPQNDGLTRKRKKN